MRVLALLAAFLFAAAAHAVEPGERLSDPALEARARALSRELRCLVCQNESIDESHADLAHDIRVLLRERLEKGDSDEAVRQYLVSRYGEFVLLKPRFEPATYALWLGPPALLALAALALWRRARRSTKMAEAPPLSEAEQARLARLLQEDS